MSLLVKIYNSRSVPVSTTDVQITVLIIGVLNEVDDTRYMTLYNGAYYVKVLSICHHFYFLEYNSSSFAPRVSKLHAGRVQT